MQITRPLLPYNVGCPVAFRRDALTAISLQRKLCLMPCVHMSPPEVAATFFKSQRSGKILDPKQPFYVPKPPNSRFEAIVATLLSPHGHLFTCRARCRHSPQNAKTRHTCSTRKQKNAPISPRVRLRQYLSMGRSRSHLFASSTTGSRPPSGSRTCNQPRRRRSAYTYVCMHMTPGTSRQEHRIDNDDNKSQQIGPAANPER